MFLTREEEAVLNGERGLVKQKAMEILVALGEIYAAEKLIPVSSTQVSGVSYKTLGEAGLDWVESLAGEKVCVKTTLNPAGMDLELWQKMGVPHGFAEKQVRVIDAFGKLGIPPLCTCTPYLIGNSPRLGEHIAWSESSAVCYANAVLGARTNREGGPSALASALVGKTACYGCHIRENREASLSVKVSTPLSEESDFSALGYWVGRAVEKGVPYFQGVEEAGNDELKALGAALATSSGIALYHVENITPEAMLTLKHPPEEALQFGEAELRDSYTRLTTVKPRQVDLVCFGCPHASIDEIKRISEFLNGKVVRHGTRLWVFTSIGVRKVAERCGYLERIKRAGGEVYADTCMVVAPLEQIGFNTVAVNSAKAAAYMPTTSKVEVFFGTLRECIDFATGNH